MVRRGGTILACIPNLHRLSTGCIEAFMGLFATARALDRLEDRLRSLELKCDDSERTVKSLNLQYIELYDKVSHQMSRMAKRYSRAKANGEELPEVETPAEPEDGIDPISRSILARRGQRRPTQ